MTRNRQRRAPASGQCARAGFSLVELLVVIGLIAVALVPALQALTTGVQGAELHTTTVEDHYHVLGRLEDVLAEPFADLDAEAQAVADPTVATAYSDLAGTPSRRLVYLARWDGDDADSDGDPFTGGDAGLLWVRVELEQTGRTLESLTRE